MHTPPPTHAAPQSDPAAQPPSLPASPAAPPPTASTPLAPPATVSLAELTADAAARDRDEDAWCTRELIRRRTHPATEHHKLAAEHHKEAAKHHEQAAEHHAKGDTAQAAEQAHHAHGHATHAMQHAEEAAKSHATHESTKK